MDYSSRLTRTMGVEGGSVGGGISGGGGSFGGGAGTGIGGGIGAVSVGVSVAPAISLGPAIGLGSSFPEGAGVTLTQVANLDSGPIGGWGLGLAGPGLSFGSRSGFSTSFTEELPMFDPTYQTNFNSQSELNVSDALFEAESILAQAARPQIVGGVNLDPAAPLDSQAEQIAEEDWLPDISIATLVAIYGQPEVFGLLGPKPEVPVPVIETVVPPEVEPVVPAPAWVINTTVEPELLVKPQVLPAPILEPFVRPAPSLEPALETKKAVATEITQVVQATAPVSLPEQTIEKAIPSDKQEEIVEIRLKDEEQVEKVKALHVIDRKTAAVRIGKILAKATQIAAGLTFGKPHKIKGVEITSGLPTSNKQEIRGGEINRKDPQERLADKTWDATIEQLNGLEFDSIGQIRAQVPTVVLDNHPVIVAKEGELASDKNVVRSHQNNVESQAHLVFEKRKRTRKEQIIKFSRSFAQQPAQVVLDEEKKVEQEEPIHPELAQALGAVQILGLTDSNSLS